MLTALHTAQRDKPPEQNDLTNAKSSKEIDTGSMLMRTKGNVHEHTATLASPLVSVSSSYQITLSEAGCSHLLTCIQPACTLAVLDRSLLWVTAG